MAIEHKLSYTVKEIEELLNNAEKAVIYAQQGLTPEQQAQVRNNIGMGKDGDVDFGAITLKDPHFEDLSVALHPLSDGHEGHAALKIYDRYYDDNVVLSGIADPIRWDDAANKKYVDDSLDKANLVISPPTDDDEGKFLRVVNGAPSWVSVAKIEEVEL